MEVKQIERKEALELLSHKGHHVIETPTLVVYRMFEEDLQKSIIFDKNNDKYLLLSFSVFEINSYLHLIDFII